MTNNIKNKNKFDDTIYYESKFGDKFSLYSDPPRYSLTVVTVRIIGAYRLAEIPIELLRGNTLKFTSAICAITRWSVLLMQGRIVLHTTSRFHFYTIFFYQKDNIAPILC